MLEFHGDGLRNVATECQGSRPRMSAGITPATSCYLSASQHCMPGKQGQVGPAARDFAFGANRKDASFDCPPDRRTVSLALRCPGIVEGRRPNCDRRRCTLERVGVDLRRSTSEFKFDCAGNFMRRALEVAAEIACSRFAESGIAAACQGRERASKTAPHSAGICLIPSQAIAKQNLITY